MSFKILDWRISVGYSIISGLVNFGYGWWLYHGNLVMALKFSAISFLTVGGMHLVHSVKKSS